MHYIFTYYLGGVCNFTCSYCHQNDTLLYGKNSDKIEKLRTKESMDSDSYEGSLSIIEKYSSKGSITVNLFGGETFLYKKQLIFILGKLNLFSNSRDININISTNASIYDEQVLTYLSNCIFKSKKIDVSWHVLEHPEYISKIDFFCENMKNSFSDISLKATFVIHASILNQQKTIIQTLIEIFKSIGKGGITINFDISHYWSKQELGEIYKLLKRIQQLGLDKKCNIFFETLDCPELQEGLINFFFLPQGDIFICPYMIITGMDFERYNSHRVGNFLENSPEEVFRIIDSHRDKYLFCKTCVSGKKQCFFLHDATKALNQIILKVFPQSKNDS